MDELILSYLKNNKDLLCEEWLYSKCTRLIYEYQESGKTYFKVRIGEGNNYKNIIISLKEILVFLFEQKQDRSTIQKFQSPNTNL